MLQNHNENVNNAFSVSGKITFVSITKNSSKIRVILHNLKKRGEFSHLVIVYLVVRQFGEPLVYY